MLYRLVKIWGEQRDLYYKHEVCQLLPTCGDTSEAKGG